MPSLNRKQFQWFCSSGSFLAVFAVTIIMGCLENRIVSNLLWGSIYGLGLCLGAFIEGEIGRLALLSGLIWLLVAPVLVYFSSGKLWQMLPESRRKIVTIGLLLSFAVCLPTDVIWQWDVAHGVHLPDLFVHLASL